MIQIHKFEQDIYPFELYITISKDAKPLEERFINTDKTEITGLQNFMSQSYAMTTEIKDRKTNKYGILIIFDSNKSINFNNVCHEAVHASKFIFQYIGADINPHEPFEYLCGWVAKCCEEVKKFKKPDN